MKRLICIHAALLFVFSVATAQNLVWQKSFGGVQSDAGRGIVATSDGGVLAVGYTSSLKSTPAAGRSGYLVRTDADGKLLWEKAIGGYYIVELDAVFDNGDNSFTVIGDGIQGQTAPFSNIRIYMARIDQEGEVIWEKFLSDSLRILRTINARSYSSGGFVVLARTQFGNPHLLRVNEQGEVQWNRTFALRPEEDTPAANVRELADGSLVMTGRELDAMYLMKVSADGDSLWKRQYRSTQALHDGRDIIEKNDGTLLLFAYSVDVRFAPGGHLYVVHTDAEGNRIDEFRHIRAPRNEVISAQVTFDGGLILVGKHDDGENARAYFVRTNSDGEVLWEFIPEAERPQANVSVRQLDDGSFIAVGSDDTGLLVTRISEPVSAVEEIRALPASINFW